MRFGTDGIRGRAGEEVTVDLALRLGAAVARVLGPRVAVASDGRPSGPMLEAAVVAGVAGAGGVARRLGVLPSPALSWAVARGEQDAGVMVTASHNPAPDNGLKVFLHDGTKPGAELRAGIERALEAAPPAGLPGRVESDHEAGEAYVRRLVDALGAGASGEGRWLRGRSVVVDTANGAATGLAARVLVALGARVWALGDGDGAGINAGCGALHPEGLAAAVVAREADAGIALDGDGDRGVLVDRDGRVLDGDALLWLGAAEGVDPPVVVGTVMSNLGLERGLAERGLRLERTPVGDAEVTAGMRATGARLGGEPSGHLLYAGGPPTADGLYSTLRALRGGPLGPRLAGYRPTSQAHATLPRAGVELDRAVATAAALVEEGARVVVRPSGTEPVVRVMVEHADPAVARAGVKRLARALRPGG